MALSVIVVFFNIIFSLIHCQETRSIDFKKILKEFRITVMIKFIYRFNLLFSVKFALRIAVEILFEEREKIGTKSLVSLLAKTPLSFFILLFFFVLKQRNKIQGCIKSC